MEPKARSLPSLMFDICTFVAEHPFIWALIFGGARGFSILVLLYDIHNSAYIHSDYVSYMEFCVTHRSTRIEKNQNRNTLDGERLLIPAAQEESMDMCFKCAYESCSVDHMVGTD